MASKEQQLIIKIKAQADQASKDIKKLTGEIKQLSTENSKVSNSSKGIDKVSKGYSGLTKVIGGVVAGFGALGVAVTAFDLAKLAGEAERASSVFENLFTDMGLNAEVEFEKIREASKGLVDEASLKQSAVTAVSLGVPIEKLAELMEVARVKALVMGTDVKSAFNDLAIGIGRGSPMILDNLGLTIKLEDANQAYAEKIGKTTAELTKQERQIALTNAVLKASEADMKRFGDAELSASEQAQAFVKEMTELKTAIGKELLDAMKELTKETTNWIKSIDRDEIKDFGDKIQYVIDKAKQLWKILGYINDLPVPDANGEKLTFTSIISDFTGAYIDTLTEITEEIDAFMNVQGELFETGRGYEVLKGQIADFAGDSTDWHQLNNAMKQQIEQASKLHTAWSNAEGDAYKDSIVEIEKTLEGLGDEYAKLALMKPFETTITEADLADSILKKHLAGTKELSDLVKDFTEEKLEALQKSNKEEIAETTKKIAELERLEKGYQKDILKAYDNYYKELSDIAKDKFSSELSISDKVRSALQETMTTIDQFKDRQLQAEEKLALATDALQRNQLDKYQVYIKQYEQLKAGQIDKEIRGGELVEKSQASIQTAVIEMYNRISDLQDQYFKQREDNAKKELDATVALRNAQIDASVALLEAKKQELKIQKEIAELTTGKKLAEIDFTSLDKALHSLRASKTLVDSITARPIKLDVEGTSLDTANQKIEQIKTLTLNGLTLPIDANTTPLDFKIQKTITRIEGNDIIIGINPEYEKAVKIIKDKLVAPAENAPIKKKVEVDVKDSKKEIDKDLKPIEDEPISKELEMELKQAIADVDAFKDDIQVPTLHPINVDNSEPQRAIAENKKNTSSVHTIYIREVHSRAGGGSLPQKLAIGGTFTGSGRVAGYDPTDSDKVNAYLTGGEYVIKRSAVDRYGVAFLNMINSMKLPKINGYASGGLVNTNTNKGPQMRPLTLNIGGNSFAGGLIPSEVASALKTFIDEEGGL